MTICDKHSACLDFEALYLRAHWSESSHFFEKLAKFLVAIDHNTKNRCPKIFHPKVIGENENAKNLQCKASSLSSISTIRIQLLPNSAELVKNQPFLMPH